MKPKGIETSGALADNSTKLCTDRPTAVEEVTSLDNMTSWRSSLRWEESYKPSPIWRSQKIHSKTRTELLFLGTEKSKQRYQKKSCINPEHQPQKATRPALGLFISVTAWCLLPCFVAGWPREDTVAKSGFGATNVSGVPEKGFSHSRSG